MSQTTVAGSFITDNTIGGDKLTLASQAAGDIMYYNGTDWIRLAKGTADQVLTMNDGATAPGWEAAAAGATLSGSTNNTVVTVTGANAMIGEANLTFDGTNLTVGTGNVIIGTSGKGIDFSAASGSASGSQSALFDDYEEGTFTPQIADATHDGSGEGQTYTTQTGKYTKIGDLVFIQLYLAVNSLGTLTGGDTAHIEGLPFTTSGRGSLTVGAAGSLALNNASETVAANLNNGVTYITLRNWDSTGGVSVLTITEFSAGGEIEIAGFYPV